MGSICDLSERYITVDVIFMVSRNMSAEKKQKQNLQQNY